MVSENRQQVQRRKQLVQMLASARKPNSSPECAGIFTQLQNLQGRRPDMALVLSSMPCVSSVTEIGTSSQCHHRSSALSHLLLVSHSLQPDSLLAYHPRLEAAVRRLLPLPTLVGFLQARIHRRLEFIMRDDQLLLRLLEKSSQHPCSKQTETTSTANRIQSGLSFSELWWACRDRNLPVCTCDLKNRVWPGRLLYQSSEEADMGQFAGKESPLNEKQMEQDENYIESCELNKTRDGCAAQMAENLIEWLSIYKLATGPTAEQPVHIPSHFFAYYGSLLGQRQMNCNH